MRFLSQTITFLQQETTEIKKSNQGCLGDIPQVQAGADIEKLHAQTPTPAARRSDNSDDMLCIGNMDTRTKEHERMIQSTQRKMLRLMIQTKRRNKKIVNHKVKNSEDINDNEEKDTDDLDGKIGHFTTTRTATYLLQPILTKELTYQ